MGDENVQNVGIIVNQLIEICDREVIVYPPIKSQGIKTKLVPWIRSVIPKGFTGTWIEPFMGTGAVAFNLAPQQAVLCDSNPHLVNFYSSIANGDITPEVVRDYLVREGEKLLSKGEGHYYFIRERFNSHHAPLDFLFLNRAGFNGLDFGLFKPPPRVDPARHPSHGKIIPTGRCRFWS